MKQLLVFLFLLCSTSMFAQDVIVKKDGSHIECRVVEVNDSGVVYKKWSNLNGNNFEIDRADVSSVNYGDGKKMTFSETNNLYKPGNQNDGMQQYNDNALLAIDAASYRYDPAKQAKKHRFIGWVGGATLVAGGIILFALYQSNIDTYGDDYDDKWLLPVSIGCAGAGVAWTWGFLSSAKRKTIEANRLRSSSIYHLDLPFSNASSLSIGADLLSDRAMGNNTLGLGLRYNF